jgi:hypothetical protein
LGIRYRLDLRENPDFQGSILQFEIKKWNVHPVRMKKPMRRRRGAISAVGQIPRRLLDNRFATGEIEIAMGRMAPSIGVAGTAELVRRTVCGLCTANL